MSAFSVPSLELHRYIFTNDSLESVHYFIQNTKQEGRPFSLFYCGKRRIMIDVFKFSTGSTTT